MTSTTPEARPRRFRPGIWLRAAALTAVAVHPAASLASRWSWPGDLLSHFQEPALALTVAVALALLLRRPRWLAAPLLALAVFQAVPLVRYSGANPRPADPDRPHRLRILMANVLYQNDDATGLTRLIRAERPDVVGLVEFTEGWRDGLESVRGDYPYRVEYPGGPSGLALWFRERPAFLGDPDWLVPPPGNPVIHARFEFAGGPREFWLVHPRSPLKRPIGEPGNPEVEALGAAVAGAAGSRIVVGDMNSTDGSAHVRDFLRRTGLRDSRLGFGRQGSWPANLPYRIAIDHLFLSPDLAVVDRRLGPSIGSDHLPLIVDLAPAGADAEKTIRR